MRANALHDFKENEALCLLLVSEKCRKLIIVYKS